MRNLTDTAVLRQSVSTLSTNHSSEEESAEEKTPACRSNLTPFLSVDPPPPPQKTLMLKIALFENKKNL